MFSISTFSEIYRSIRRFNSSSHSVSTAGGEGLRAAVDLVKDKNRVCTFFAYDLVEELVLRVVRGERSAARLAELVELHSAGKLSIHIRQTFPLDRAGVAHRAIETRRGRGKIILTID